MNERPRLLEAPGRRANLFCLTKIKTRHIFIKFWEPFMDFLADTRTQMFIIYGFGLNKG